MGIDWEDFYGYEEYDPCDYGDAYDMDIRRAERMQYGRRRYVNYGLCPCCNSSLTLRVAKRGYYKGNPFIACTAFPKCYYKKKIPC